MKVYTAVESSNVGCHICIHLIFGYMLRGARARSIELGAVLCDSCSLRFVFFFFFFFIAQAFHVIDRRGAANPADFRFWLIAGASDARNSADQKRFHKAGVESCRVACQLSGGSATRVGLACKTARNWFA